MHFVGIMSGLEGFALTSLRIDGINHEFSTIEGVVEDVTEIVLNKANSFQTAN